MEESRDPAIKLFGKTIPLRPVQKAPNPSVEAEKDRSSIRDATNFETQDRGTAQEQSAEHDKPMKNSEPDEQEADASKSQEEAPKRPDKILPCPRCNSLDTKFCYFNNYNANQPRHFCKNCQRYWTAGGTMRNVPVGAGRRKNKNTASHFRSVTVSDAIFQTVRQDDQDAIHHHPLKPNGTVLSFGSDAPFPGPMAPIHHTTNNGIGSVPHRIEEQVDLNPIVENGDEHSSGSSMTASSSIEDRIRANSQQPPIENHQAFDPRIPYFNGSPWPYQWAPAPFCSSNFAIPFYPATTYWGCTPAGAWSIPWLSPPLASFPTCDSSESGPISPTLGKHSRDADVIEQINSENGDTFDQSKQERRLWIPKTLRIDDPEAAAKSSIWTTIGFKDTDNGGGIFKSFHKKGNVKNHMAEASQVLHANPAALSRSLNFQESS